ncbi:MAG: sigma factor-like helix-turn-helix DNA-binding protein [Actinomycetota bacterium]
MSGQPVPGEPTAELRPVLDFETFYRQRYTAIARALAYALRDVELGQEAADEAMARAYPRWGKLCTYDNPSGWVYRVGLNWARSVHRRLSRSLPWRESESYEPPLSDPGVAAALRRLDDKHRDVVVCRLLLDWSVEQTADALELKPGTVKSRLHHALGRLKADLEPGTER